MPLTMARMGIPRVQSPQRLQPSRRRILWYKIGHNLGLIRSPIRRGFAASGTKRAREDDVDEYNPNSNDTTLDVPKRRRGPYKTKAESGDWVPRKTVVGAGNDGYKAFWTEHSFKANQSRTFTLRCEDFVHNYAMFRAYYPDTLAATRNNAAARDKNSLPYAEWDVSLTAFVDPSRLSRLRVGTQATFKSLTNSSKGEAVPLSGLWDAWDEENPTKRTRRRGVRDLKEDKAVYQKDVPCKTDLEVQLDDGSRIGLQDQDVIVRVSMRPIAK
ncbi:uncharacterized protein I303_108527 [Kwoniella dejecticola CBS 10117]|uniref:Uncharacterized protein n=1 Tax=Kwoniella dejecticola CBS 10117 TaxID=1296121 RepID=A0A1A5ZX53_9TREE|nr:uncharacterized protein I303_07149 [Kwoniella dejecticola CBS 10117]OBR82390.1 hypothetical protein I303_07149 [Kwoniella dejecticola CBS 10117]